MTQEEMEKMLEAGRALEEGESVPQNEDLIEAGKALEKEESTSQRLEKEKAGLSPRDIVPENEAATAVGSAMQKASGFNAIEAGISTATKIITGEQTVEEAGEIYAKEKAAVDSALQEKMNKYPSRNLVLQQVSWQLQEDLLTLLLFYVIYIEWVVIL